jgi:hypothetical protein
MNAIKIPFFMLLLLAGNTALAQKALRKINHQAFQRGEKLTFRVHYGFIDAGTATLEVAPEPTKIGPRNVYHVIGTGQSSKSFDLFFKVRDRYESYIDQDALVPWRFVRHVEEGSYKLNQNVVFNHLKDEVKSDGGVFKAPDNIQDLLSTYYYLRTLDFSQSKPGEVFTQTTFLDDEIHQFGYKYLGKETIKTDLGTFKCLKFCPTLLKGRVFKNETDMTVWITDDENHIPVRAQAKILVGSVKMDLASFSGIPQPLAMIKKN